MEKYLEDAIKFANYTVKMCNIPFEETFPYESCDIKTDDEGRKYFVRINIELVKGREEN